MDLQSIDEKIEETRAKIIKLHPNSCRSCSGRGGRLVPEFEDSWRLALCAECVLKGLDPLDMTKDLIPPDYEKDEMYDSDFFEMLEENEVDPSPFLIMKNHDVANMDEDQLNEHYRECTSPTQGERISCTWEGLPTLVQNLLVLRGELEDVARTYARLVTTDPVLTQLYH